ncbi:hypothetical protein PMAYCL1PPCAC_14288, partial [Pristionchus mayeri]
KNELACPECEYRSRSARMWWQHLKDQHSTTPSLASIFIIMCSRPDVSFVANVVMNPTRRSTCDISNFTIIRNEDELIRRLTDPPMTPQCVLCKIYPKTAYGYIYHLAKHHKTTPKANGIYLLCSCGFRFNTQNDQKKHDNK